MAEDALPTFVAAFDERQWTGRQSIIFLAPGTSLLTGAVEGGKGHQVGPVKEELLRRVNDFIAKLPAGHGDRQSMVTFVQAVAGIAPEDLVITAEQERDDLGTYSPRWYDRISSLFMMGIPNGSRTLKLFEQTNQRSHELHLRMPTGHHAASYSTIHESAFGPYGFTSPPVVPDPGQAQGGRSAKYPFRSFGNMAKSFRWDG